MGWCKLKGFKIIAHTDMPFCTKGIDYDIEVIE